MESVKMFWAGICVYSKSGESEVGEFFITYLCASQDTDLEP
jgi:hypothetical protein